MSRPKGVGPTPPNQFRLGVDAVRKLDRIVGLFARETGDNETRTSALRKIIHREYERRFGRDENK